MNPERRVKHPHDALNFRNACMHTYYFVGQATRFFYFTFKQRFDASEEKLVINSYHHGHHSPLYGIIRPIPRLASLSSKKFPWPES
jgi:hypothetical protein